MKYLLIYLKGHNYYLNFGGGTCDCGTDNWNSKTWCEKHKNCEGPIPFEEEYIYNLYLVYRKEQK